MRMKTSSRSQLGQRCERWFDPVYPVPVHSYSSRLGSESGWGFSAIVPLVRGGGNCQNNIRCQHKRLCNDNWDPLVVCQSCRACRRKDRDLDEYVYNRKCIHPLRHGPRPKYETIYHMISFRHLCRSGPLLSLQNDVRGSGGGNGSGMICLNVFCTNFPEMWIIAHMLIVLIDR